MPLRRETCYYAVISQIGRVQLLRLVILLFSIVLLRSADKRNNRFLKGSFQFCKILNRTKRLASFIIPEADLR